MISLPPDASPRDVLAHLRSQYPDAPFLALGQSVFWDEPVKAALRKLLDDNQLGGQMVVGVHDTDYFAKARVPQNNNQRFVLMPHNDGTTRALWSAAGEISTLFGSETFPTRDDFTKAGVPFRKLARSYPEGPQAFLDIFTEAWGWRGLIDTGTKDLIVNALPLREVGDGIIEMLTWGFERALDQILPGCCQDEARLVADTILHWCRSYSTSHPEANLSDLFQHLLPRFYHLLLGEPETKEGIRVDSTTNLLRLAPDTAHLPRFRFLDIFLNPQTRPLALAAYNEVLIGSEIYTLDRFGKGAIPFDAIVPGRGRGTIRLTPRVLFIETTQPIAIALKKPIESVSDMAEVLASKLGDRVTIVGKAITLVAMLAQEFIFVFHEEGSMYVTRTEQMNQTLIAAGIPLEVHPILRIRYHTWDSLSVGSSTLRPAPHIAATFGQPTITTPEFAAQWRQVIAQQKSLCIRLGEIRKPIALLEFLHTQDPNGGWEERMRAYRKARETLRRLREEAARIHSQVKTLYGISKHLKRRANSSQSAKGEHFRSTAEWLPSEIAARATFDGELKALHLQIRLIRQEVDQLKTRRMKIERGDEALIARNTLARIEEEAETARLHLVRNAHLTVESLMHTNHRPSVWWIPLLDRSGNWFRRIADTAELYLQPLS